jgi:hypothetical protein
MRKFALLVSVVGLVMALLAPTASAMAPYCGITWGSLPKSDPDTFAPGPVLGVRVGQHRCFDRLAIDLRGGEPGYTVQYVSQVGGDDEAPPLSLRGGAFLQIMVNAANRVGGAWLALRPGDRRRVSLPDLPGGRLWWRLRAPPRRRARRACPVAVPGVHPARPGDGSRLVIDVAHRWQ